MARKKIVVQREKVKPLKKKRKLSEEHKEKLRARLAEMRAKRKPAEYKNVAKSVLALPDDDKYSMKSVKEWIKESKEQVAAYNKTARSMRISPQDKQKAANLAEHKKAYIRYCEHYLKTGDWIGMFSGKEETQKVVPKCIAMAYYPDGTPKRSVGIFYPDINMIWTRDMDERDYAHMENREGIQVNPLSALTDKQFTSST
jgi:hypothetical protein|tara:strand:+ start:225 stop:824 length:600 start_codon:yes stop_codon:yes gene_type:complete